VQALTDYSLYSDLEIGSGVFEMEPVIRGIFKARGTLKIELLGIGSYDDMQWWSLAYANAGVLLNESAMVSSASAVFDHVWKNAYSNSSKECSGGVWCREKQMGSSGGSLEPPGPLLELPLGLFLRTSIPFIWRILSAFLPA
jgi:hypothetical protein